MRKYMFGTTEIVCVNGGYLSAEKIKEFECEYGDLKYVEFNHMRIKAL